MCIVLEGCDKTGKTTVINALLDYTSTRFGNQWEFHYFTNPRKVLPAPTSAFNYFADVYKTASRHSIFSRCHISNDVYGQIFNEKQDLTDEEFNILDDMLLSLKPVVIVLTDDPHNIIQRWNAQEMYPEGYVFDIVTNYYPYIEGEGRSKLDCTEAELLQLAKKVNRTWEPTKTLIDMLEKNVDECKIGWANPNPFDIRSRFHYFVGGKSLCNKWATGQIQTFELGKNEHIDNCKTCFKIMQREGVKLR